MRLRTTHGELHRALTAAGRVAGKRTVHAALGNVLLETAPDSLRLTTTDLERTLVQEIVAEIDADGSLTVPADLLAHCVSVQPSGGFLTLEQADEQLTVKGERGKTRLPTAPIADFPTVPEMPPEPYLSLDAQTFKAQVQRVAFCAATDANRPVLQGVYATFGETGLNLMAADGISLATLHDPTPQAGEGSFLVPAKALNDLVRTLGDAATLDVGLDPTRAVFRLPHATLFCQQIAGTFPNYSQLIPTDPSTRLICEASDLRQAVRQAAVVAPEGSLLLWVEPGEVRVAVHDATQGDYGDSFPSELYGQSGRIALNVKRLALLTESLNGPLEIGWEPGNLARICSVDVPGLTYVLAPVVVGDAVWSAKDAQKEKTLV